MKLCRLVGGRRSLESWTASTPTPTTSPHQANHMWTGQLEWVSVSPSPPNLSVVVGRQISNDIDAGRYGAAGRGDEDGGYLRSSDPTEILSRCRCPWRKSRRSAKVCRDHERGPCRSSSSFRYQQPRDPQFTCLFDGGTALGGAFEVSRVQQTTHLPNGPKAWKRQ